MKILGTLSAGVVSGLLICGGASADGGFDASSSAQSRGYQASQPGWAREQPPANFGQRVTQRVTGDVRKLGDGTKKFLSDTTAGTGKLLSDATAGTGRILHGAADILTLKKPSPHSNASNPLLPWTWGAKKSPPADPWVRRGQKKSWMEFLIRREEPKPVESFDDWWNLKRMDP